MLENQESSKTFYSTIKVVMDTNVVISSAISSDGNPAHIFEMLLLEKIENYTTTEIIEEIKEVMKRPKITKLVGLPEREFVISNFESFSTKIKPLISLNEVEDDPDDNKFLECAVFANVNYIISGDDHLLKIKDFRGILIITPAEFVRLIESRVVSPGNS